MCADSDEEVEPSRPLHRYWWFWAFLVLVVLAIAKQVFGVDMSWLGDERDEPPLGAAASVLCQVAPPCGLVQEIVDPKHGAAAAAAAATAGRREMDR